MIKKSQRNKEGKMHCQDYDPNMIITAEFIKSPLGGFCWHPVAVARPGRDTLTGKIADIRREIKRRNALAGCLDINPVTASGPKTG